MWNKKIERKEENKKQWKNLIDRIFISTVQWYNGILCSFSTKLQYATPKNKYLKCVNEFSQSIDFLFVYEIYYFDIIVEKKYIISIAHNSRLLFYYANRSHHNLRQNHTQRQITSRRSIAEKTLPKRVPLYDRHVRNRVSLNCPRCFRRKCIENAFESSLSDIMATRSTDSGSPELRLYYWDSPSFLQNYCYA